ncbi:MULTISPECIES: helix-turn-helix domain-containing protein [Vagococcus]|uniref:HTH cro/C1-type domain-containing protein n=1 Tax=Vagococcus luciliae TaxID=2920380 RepID=A0ABY5P0Y9_9ENTE|nr:MULTISPECIES: XRE family transcriptional regulator [Vagococcus]UUV99589.1 hypothetical protein G314FT_17500 [Vagococcus luciliae]
MIRNNLSILLSERGMKNTALSIKTGISKNTISSLTQNDGKMIQLETINKICQVLDIDPGDFFSYIPFDFEIIFSFNNFDAGCIINESFNISEFWINDSEFDLFIRVLKGNEEIDFFEFESIVEFNQNNLLINDNRLNILTNKVINEDKFNEMWEKIPISFRIDIVDKVEECFFQELTNQLEQYFKNRNTDNLIEDSEWKLIVQNIKKMVSYDFDFH